MQFDNTFTSQNENFHSRNKTYMYRIYIIGIIMYIKHDKISYILFTYPIVNYL